MYHFYLYNDFHCLPSVAVQWAVYFILLASLKASLYFWVSGSKIVLNYTQNMAVAQIGDTTRLDAEQVILFFLFSSDLVKSIDQ